MLPSSRLQAQPPGRGTSREWGSHHGRRTIIAGSADGVLTVFRYLRNGNGPSYHVIGFVDDDPTAHRSLVGGVRVLGPAARLPALARLYGAEHVIFCFPYMADAELRGLVAAVLHAGLTAEVARLDVLPADAWLAARPAVTLVEAATPQAGA